MAQTIGVHIGERRWHVVALEGGLKKHKVLCAVAGEIGQDDDGESMVEALRELVKEHKLSADSVYLACDSGMAAFRTLTLPFDDRSKIEEVIKFEIEGNLPQYDIHQVVVDFLVLNSKPGVESTLLVTAVPKDRLARVLKLAERGGLEPLEAELEGTALFDAALEAGVLAEDSGTVLIHVGDTATTVVVADGQRLSSLRAIRAGAFPPTTPAPDAPAGEAAPAGEPEPADAAGRSEDSVRRIRRELARTLSGARTTNEIRNIYLVGHELPGLAGEELLGLSIALPPIVPGDIERPGEFAVAYGAALRGFAGGSLKPSLRREELRFTGKFERLELPLAVFSLLLFTLLFVRFIVTDKQIEWRDEGDIAGGSPGDMQLWLEASNLRLFPDPKNPAQRPTRMAKPPTDLANYATRAQAGADDARTKYEEIVHIREELAGQVQRLSKELGQISEIKQPQSALEATTLVMQQMGALGPDVRIGIRSYEATYTRGQSGKEDFVTVMMDTDFFGADSVEATRNKDQLANLFGQQPWCMEFEGKSSKVMDGDKGIYVDRLTIKVNVDKAKQAAGGQP